jgi:acyl carrier protein
MAGQPYLSEIARVATDEKPRERFRSTLEATTPAARPGLVEGHVREQICRVLRADPASIDRLAPFRSLGIDSLMSIEVRNRLEASLGLRLPATLLFTHPNLAALVDSLLRDMQLVPAAESTAAPRLAETSALDAAREELERTTASELLALLDEELALNRKGNSP